MSSILDSNDLQGDGDLEDTVQAFLSSVVDAYGGSEVVFIPNIFHKIILVIGLAVLLIVPNVPSYFLFLPICVFLIGWSSLDE